MKALLATAIFLLFTLTGLAETKVRALHLGSNSFQELMPRDGNGNIEKFRIENPIADIVKTKVYDVSELFKSTGISINEVYCVYLETPQILIARASEEDWSLIDGISTEISAHPVIGMTVSFFLKSSDGGKKSFLVKGRLGDEVMIGDKHTAITCVLNIPDANNDLGSLDLTVTHKDLKAEVDKRLKVNTETPLASWKNKDLVTTALSASIDIKDPADIINLESTQQMITAFDKQYIKNLK